MDHHRRPSPGPEPAARPLPADPDTDTGPAPAGVPPGRRRWEIVGAIAVGGAIGACARYGASLAWPSTGTGFPWTTLAVNLSGCAAMGVLMVLVHERTSAHHLARPFLGTGVLGGYTTFATYAVEAGTLLTDGRLGTAAAYLTLTLAGALGALWAAASLTRRLRAGATRVSGRAPHDEGDRP
ncbi:CrcB family protein [Streptomyces sp. SM14]|uniref:fluoride efflux transporter FluC n=1 Tax=Streptomyces sp. SM14 TaxID=1736045 RepID=UPI002156401A|nr:CrcB family protein [Streptomyces sp. SM14]